MSGRGACRVAAVLGLAGWALAAWLWLRPAAGEWVVEPVDSVGGRPAAQPVDVSRARMDAILAEMAADPELAGAAVGYCVLDESGKVLLSSPLAQTAMPPASALKPMTSAAALQLLGPDFKFETQVLASSSPGPDGRLEGDLLLRGAGDPTLGSDALDALAAAVVQAGVKRIAGRLLVDASVFPANPLSDHWNWGDVGNGYGVGAYGLNVDHNLINVRFDAGERGAPATLRTPPTGPAGLRWINEVTTGEPATGDQVVAYSEPYGRTITLRGSVPLGEVGFPVRVANPDPPAQAAESLRAALERRGVVVEGGAGARTTGAALVLAKHTSEPLTQIIQHLHRVSDNLEAQCLFLVMGCRAGEEPASALQKFWAGRGVGFTGLRILDGSGLARANMIRPVDLATVLQRALTGPHGELFHATLTEYGPGNRAKVGAMSGVRTEVGVLRNTSQMRIYCIMTNGLPPGARLGRHRDALVNLAGGA